LRLSAHVVARDPRQLAGQLVGRLIGEPEPELRTLCLQAKQLAPLPCLIPRTPSLTAPGGPLLRTLTGHTGPVNAVALTADGTLAVSGCNDNTLKVWDLDTEAILAEFTADGLVHVFAINSSGKTIIAGDALGRVHFLSYVE